MKARLTGLYLDWCNNWLTVARFADHYDLDRDTAQRVIRLGRVLHRRSASPRPPALTPNPNPYCHE